MNAFSIDRQVAGEVTRHLLLATRFFCVILHT